VLVQFLSEANNRSRSPIAASAFVSADLNGRLIPFLECKLALKDNVFSYLDTPAVVSASVKQQALGAESRRAGRFKLFVRRNGLIVDFVAKLSREREGRIREKLVVQFEGEQGTDKGGVSREFFYLLCTELFADAQSPFVKMDEYYWFKEDISSSAEDRAKYRAAGLMIRMALVNGVILPLRFPRAVYKMLKNEPTTIRDYAEMCPGQAAQLEETRAAYRRGEDYGLVFAVTTADGANDVALKEGGADLEVTRDNVDEYVALFVDYRMRKSVLRNVRVFVDAFQTSGETKIMSKLMYTDYDTLVSGADVEDWEELKESTKYEGYERGDPAVVIFWRVFDGLSALEKGKMLQFATGTARAPLDGFATMGFTIARGGGPTTLPKAHTCVNRLDLPDCRDEVRVRANLQICIANAEGFGFV
jgi:hypothetical protein